MRWPIVLLLLAGCGDATQHTEHDAGEDRRLPPCALVNCVPEAGSDALVWDQDASQLIDAGPEDAPFEGCPESGCVRIPIPDGACTTICELFAGQTGDGGYDPDAGYGVWVEECCTPGKLCKACLGWAGCDFYGTCGP